MLIYLKSWNNSRCAVIRLLGAITFGQLTIILLRRTIITLKLTLTIFSVSLGQNFKKEIKDGLYLWSSGLVIQQISDTLRIFKLAESKKHFYKFASVVPHSHKFFGASQPISSELFPESDKHRPMDILIKPTRITDIIEPSKSTFSIIFPNEIGFCSANFVKGDFGYEMYFSNHGVKRKEDMKKSINRDTTTYFMLHAFTLTDLRNLQQLKKFDDINQTDFEILLNSMQSTFARYQRLLENSMIFGIKIEGYKNGGVIESRELITKCLLGLKYNPLIDPNDLDVMEKKYKPKR